MTFQILLSIPIGVFFGIVTGILPGIHPNTVVTGLLAISPFLLSFTSPIVLAVFITTVATVNTFVDNCPSCYLGAPEENTALGLLPMHRYLLEGKGHEAILLTVIGSLFSLILGLILVIPIVYTLKTIFPFLKKIIIYLLILSVIYLFYREKQSRILAAIVFLLSGLLGIITLNFPNLPQPLFPLFSGLFGISTMVVSLNSKSKIPKQYITYPKIKSKEILTITPVSVFSGGLVSTLPALGPSQAAIIGSALLRNLSTKNFLMMIGGINSINFVLSFISLYVIDKARNGTIVGISQLLEKISLNQFILFLSVCMIAAGLGAVSTIYISKIFAKYIEKVNYELLILSIISMVALLVLIISGFYGFLILITSTFIGIIPTLKNIGKTHLMGSLMIPVILFYLL